MSWWSGTERDVIQEALREYVGDGDGEDELILSEYERQVKAGAWDEGYSVGIVPDPSGDNPYYE